MSTIKKECEVIMLPTEKAENCLQTCNNKDLKNVKGYYTQEYLKSENRKSFHLYILSSEEIKEPCYGYIISTSIVQYLSEIQIKVLRKENWKKVIATTNQKLRIQSSIRNSDELDIDYGKLKWILPQPSKEFIESYIKAFNEDNPISKVMIEYEIDKFDKRNQYQDCPSGKYWEDKPLSRSPEILYSNAQWYIPKVNSSNEISITKVKDTYTTEEVAKLLRLFGSNSTPNEITEKWIEENL